MIPVAIHPFARGPSAIHRLDPRTRLVCASAGSVWVAAQAELTPLCAALAGGLLLVWLARLPGRVLMRRFAGLNVLMAFALASLPFSVSGAAIAVIGPLVATDTGLHKALTVVLAGNALGLLFSALVATIEPTTLAHALLHLRVPEKLVRIMMFAVRYVDVINQSRHRLMRAMRARGYVARMERHTLETTANLVGALLAESIERAQRIELAMRCRGWRGQFHVLNHFRFDRADYIFGSAFLLSLTCCGLLP